MEFLKNIIGKKYPEPKEMRDHLARIFHPDLPEAAGKEGSVMAEINLAYAEAKGGKPQKLQALFRKYENYKPSKKEKPSKPPHKKIDTYA
jgi:hypothetical protein